MPFILNVRPRDGTEESYEIDLADLTLGADPSVDIAVRTPVLAPRQGIFRPSEDALLYVPLASPRGTTLLRGEEIEGLDPATHPQLELRPGDRLMFGKGPEGIQLEIRIEGSEGLVSVPAESVTAAEGESLIVATRSVKEVEKLDARIRQRHRNVVATLYRLIQPLRAHQRLEDLATAAAEGILKEFQPSTHVTIFLPGDDPDPGLEPTFVRQRRALRGAGVEGHVVSRTLLDQVTRERMSVLVTDAQSQFEKSTTVLLSGIRSSILVPLFADEQLAGVLQVDSRRKPGVFTEMDLDILTVFGDHLAAVLWNARLRDQLARAQAALKRENEMLRRSLTARGRPPALVRESARMRQVYAQVENAARESLPILVYGETGTGKELIARTAHALSPCAEGPFVPINCGAIPRDLLESELFGHAKGAFTGATVQRSGLFLKASGGTLLLDELTELPLDLQVKLLRALEEGSVRAVGSDRFQPVDVRIIATTNRDPEAEIERGRLRADLYYRLNVFRIDVPPLRERPEDVLPLADQFLQSYCADAGKRIPGFSPGAAALLLAYSWPGNARELRNEVERAAAASSSGQWIQPAALTPRVRGESEGERHRGGGTGLLQTSTEALERRMIEDALQRFDDNISRAAEYLGLSRPGLRLKMARHGITKQTDG